MKIIKKGEVFRSKEGFFTYHAWPTVTRDEKGTLYAICSGMRVWHVCPFGKDVMNVSYDGGETWSAPIVVNDTWLDDRDAGIAYLGDGKLIMSYFNHPVENYARYKGWSIPRVDQYSKEFTAVAFDEIQKFTEEMNHSGSFVRLSRDYGFSWEEAVKVPVSSPHGPVPAKGRLIWLGREMYATDSKTRQNTIACVESRDDGKTWTYLGEVPTNPADMDPEVGWCEPDVLELPDGTLLGAIRVEGAKHGIMEGGTIYLTRSEDGGKTWSVPEPSGLSGLPPRMTLLNNGDILMVYARRVKPYGIYASVSHDGGKSFVDEVCLDDASELEYAGDIGYPASVQLEDGSIVTVFYKIVPGDEKPSILYTKWSL